MNQLKRIKEMALNLLAVIHRDGGQHTAAVGITQSFKDAEEKVFALLAQSADAIVSKTIK